MSTQLRCSSVDARSSDTRASTVGHRLLRLVPRRYFRLTGKWLRRISDATVLVLWSGLYCGLVVAFQVSGWAPDVVRSAGGYQTLLQTVPAAVIAVYAFVLGSVLVIAQLITPSRGSRAVRMLLLDVRLRGVVAGTLVLGLMGTWLAAQAPDPTAMGDSAAVALRSWPFTGAAALAVVGGLVLLSTVVVLGQMCHRYCTPYQFHRRLAAFARWGQWPLIEATKAWRQWLCTAARDGASRDLLYSCRTAILLARAYLEAVERDEGFRLAPPKQADEREAGEEPPGWARARPVAERALAPASTNSKTSAATDAAVGADDAACQGWYVRQLSKALVRAVEEGARADVAWRNLDELLVTQERLLELMVEGDRVAEAGHVLCGMAEICCLAQQAEAERTKKWFARPWSALSVVEKSIDEADGLSPEGRAALHARGREIRRAVQVRLPSTRTVGPADTGSPLLPPWVDGPTDGADDSPESPTGVVWFRTAWSFAAGARGGEVLRRSPMVS